MSSTSHVWAYVALLMVALLAMANPTWSYRVSPQQPSGSIQQQLIVSKPASPQTSTDAQSQAQAQAQNQAQGESSGPASVAAPSSENSQPEKNSNVISLDSEKADVIIMKNENKMHVVQDKMQNPMGDDGGCMNCVYNDDHQALLEVFGPDTCIQLVDKLPKSSSSSAISQTLPVATTCGSSSSSSSSSPSTSPSSAGSGSAATTTSSTALTLPSLPSSPAQAQQQQSLTQQAPAPPQAQQSSQPQQVQQTSNVNPVLKAVAQEAANQAVSQVGEDDGPTTLIRNRNTLIHIARDKLESGCQNCVYDNLDSNNLESNNLESNKFE